MNDHIKTKAQLIAELQELRQKTSQATLAEQSQTAVMDWATIILDNIPYLAWIKDTEGVFLAANKHFVEASGFEASELIGKTDFEVWPLDLAEKYVTDDLEVLQSGQSKLLEEPIDDHYSRSWFETFKTPVRDENGSIIGVVGLAHDITNRKDKEDDLRNSAEFFDAVINAIADPLFVKDEKHRLIVVNDAMSSFMGLRSEDIIGKSDDEIFPEEEVEVFWEQDNKVFASDHPIENEEYFTDAEGVQHTISTKKMAHRLPNGQKVLTGTIRDITERKRAEAVLAKRAAELETVVEVSAKISTILDSDQLLQEVVDLTKERFNLYHVHVYLVDDTKDTLKLMAGAGDAGRKMVEQGWHIDLDHKNSLVAQTARSRHGVIANDVRRSSHFLPNPLLPHTKSELAVPIIFGDDLLGVLDVQADQVALFTDDDVQIQTILATQIAIAVQNSRLFAQMLSALTETELLYDMSAELNATHTLDEILQTVISNSIVTGANQANIFNIEVDQTGHPEWLVLRATWGHEAKTTLSPGTRLFVPDLPGASLWLDAADEVVMIENIFSNNRLTPQIRHYYQQIDGQATVILPLRLGYDWIGLMSINWPDPKEFDDKDKRFYKSLAAQTAVLLNNKLLLENTQRRAEREQLVNSIGQKIQQTTTTERALQTVIKELGHALQTARIQVNLTTGD